MARKALIEKDKKRKILSEKKFIQRQELKNIIKSFTVSDEEKTNAIKKLTEMPRDSAKVRVRNRCQLTGRSRGYYRKFCISRLCFRELAAAGFIPGVTKSSW